MLHIVLQLQMADRSTKNAANDPPTIVPAGLSRSLAACTMENISRATPIKSNRADTLTAAVERPPPHFLTSSHWKILPQMRDPMIVKTGSVIIMAAATAIPLSGKIALA